MRNSDRSHQFGIPFLAITCFTLTLIIGAHQVKGEEIITPQVINFEDKIQPRYLTRRGYRTASLANIVLPKKQSKEHAMTRWSRKTPRVQLRTGYPATAKNRLSRRGNRS